MLIKILLFRLSLFVVYFSVGVSRMAILLDCQKSFLLLASFSLIQESFFCKSLIYGVVYSEIRTVYFSACILCTHLLMTNPVLYRTCARCAAFLV